jgi:hypothetical protein
LEDLQRRRGVEARRGVVAIGDEKEVEASWSHWFQPNPMQAMSFLPSGPQLPKAYERVEEASSGAETCCFFIDPVMKTYAANLWPDTLQEQKMPQGLPRSPLRNYNALAVGFDWQQMAYHSSTIGPGMPTGIITKDWDLTLTSRCK